jgi:uncharacterized membrane protein YcfT
MPSHSASRLDWVDYAKGICIILVVMMHSTLGVEKAAGASSWLHPFIEWAKPFRMPDFFLISGLFLASRIYRPWGSYLDTKLVHFAYFYVLWMTIQFLFKGHGIYMAEGIPGLATAWLMGFVQPYGTLWFIYMLAIFFVVVKATRGVPPLLVFAAGAILEMAPIHTGWLLVDEFASRFVYFFAGYWLASRILSFAAASGRQSTAALAAGLVVWAYVNALLVFSGWSELPGMSLLMGAVGACAVIVLGVLLTRVKAAGWIRYCGRNSIVIYLAFFLFMATSRSLLLKTGIIADLGIISLLVTAAGVIGSLMLFWLVRRTPLKLLFERPDWARVWQQPVMKLRTI